MASGKRPRQCVEDGESGSHKKLALSSSLLAENQESKPSQNRRKAVQALPRTISESVSPIFSGGSDGDVPMIDVLDEAPSTFRLSGDNSNGANRSTTEGYVESEICFGALFNARAACPNGFGLEKSSFAIATKPTEALKKYPVKCKEDYHALQSQSGKDFAVLDVVTSRTLKAVENLGCVRFQAVFQCDAMHRPGMSVNTKVKRNMVEVSINLYGTSNLTEKVGAVLTRERQFLQHPDVVDPGIDYDNPHFYKMPGLTVDLNQSVKPRHHERMSKEAISSEVDKIIDSLDVVASDLDIPATDVLLTPLLSHQKTALKFILQKEKRQLDTSLWTQREESGMCLFEHQISKQLQSVLPYISAGGILADVMGLGKTLTMLAAIVHSMDEAFCFTLLSSKMSGDNYIEYSTRATLVVVTSAQLIEVWKSEIARHIAQNCLNVISFHGSDRRNEPQSFVNVDLVLTTYSTLVKDSQNAGVLHRLKWFRVILDEAHWIRNQETEQFRAVNALQADRRWCLTGTPIQNRLEDLGALIRFLKVEPFHEKSSKAVFRRCILDPIFSDDGEPYRNLRLLLRSICLRRKNHNQSNLTATYEIVTLSLSDMDRSLYDKILKQAEIEMDMLVSTSTCIQKYTRLFTVILRLRMFCDLGQFCKGLDSSSYSTDMPQAWSATDLEPGSDLGCDFCQNGESLDLMIDLTFCPSCSRVLFYVNPEVPESMPESLEATELCSLPSSNLSYELNGVIWPAVCSQQPFLEAGSVADRYPTKLLAVAKNVQDTLYHSKSIVFSCWTATLDILSRLLSELQIQFVRIDGKVSYVERSKRLAVFQESPEVSILLMTFGTGALGLNLTQANRIHIVEPQWNPTVEAQAIGRALRLGQIREVTVIRYEMEHTIEQNILEFQKRKEKLSKFAFDGGLEKSTSEKLQELRFILHVS